MDVTVVMLDNGVNLYVDMPIAGLAKELDSHLLRYCMMRLRTINHGEVYIEPAKVVGLRRGVYMQEGEHDSD